MGKKREKNVKRKANYQIKCIKNFKNTMHNWKINCFYSFKMWKTLIHGQNHTKHKIERSLSLDLFYFYWKKGKKQLKVETLTTLNFNF